MYVYMYVHVFIGHLTCTPGRLAAWPYVVASPIPYIHQTHIHSPLKGYPSHARALRHNLQENDTISYMYVLIIVISALVWVVCVVVGGGEVEWKSTYHLCSLFFNSCLCSVFSRETFAGDLQCVRCSHSEQLCHLQNDYQLSGRRYCHHGNQLM